jgi:AcrR family transcriptional regulator
VFSEKGYWETRFEDIAALAGFSKPTLYNYYDDKESIFLSLSIREFKLLSEQIKKHTNIPGTFSSNFENILRIILSHFETHFSIVINASNIQSMMSLHADMCRHKELVSEMWMTFQDITKHVEVMIVRAKSEGEITSSIDPALLARFTMTILGEVLSGWKVRKEIDSMETAVSSVMSFLKNGVGIQCRDYHSKEYRAVQE